MFTGLVEETGQIKQITKGANSYQIQIAAKSILNELKLGDSVATNGACLTVVELSDNTFTVDIMSETVKRTNFALLKPGDCVNLERAMRVNDRLGGHLVSGHIDGTGSIRQIKKDDIAYLIQIEASSQLLTQMLPKGSIAIDGISLTIVQVSDTFFEVSIIPHTAKETTLLQKQKGDMVNLETDMIGKYVFRFLEQKNTHNTNSQKTPLTMDFLAENGFI